MKTKTKIGIGIIILIIICAVVFAYKTIVYVKAENERKVKQALFNAAAKNAVEYVREKYGFEAEIIDVDESDDINIEVFNELTENMRVIKLKANERNFLVTTTCLEGNSYCVDNYQFEEIQSAAKDEILKDFPEGEIVSFWWSGNEDMPYENALILRGFNKYYDGGNLDEFLEFGSGDIEMMFAGENISESGIPERLEKLNISYLFISFDAEEHLEEYKAVRDAYESETHISYDESFCKLYAPHIVDFVCSKYENNYGGWNPDERESENLEINAIDDFKYCCFPAEGSGKCLLNMNDMPKSLGQPLSKAYELKGNSSSLYIYYPLEKLDGIAAENVGAVWYSEYRNGTERAEIYGDYAVFVLPRNATAFMIVNLTEQYE